MTDTDDVTVDVSMRLTHPFLEANRHRATAFGPI